MAINAPLQGTQSDIVKKAMVELYELFLKKYEGKGVLVLQIHDELIFEIDKDVLLELAPEIQRVMEHIIPQKELRGVPLVVSGEAGENWGEMKKISA
jgi:DNA polymerase-1